GGVWLVVDERGSPADHYQVGGVVGQGRAKDFFAFGSCQSHSFTANQFRDLVPMKLQKLGGRGGTPIFMLRRLNIDDQIVFVQPLCGGTYYRRADLLQACAKEIFDGSFNFGRVHPARRLSAEGIESGA